MYMKIESQEHNEFAMQVITECKQQLGKLLFVFAASRPYRYHAALQN